MRLKRKLIKLSAYLSPVTTRPISSKQIKLKFTRQTSQQRCDFLKKSLVLLSALFPSPLWHACLASRMRSIPHSRSSLPSTHCTFTTSLPAGAFKMIVELPFGSKESVSWRNFRQPSVRLVRLSSARFLWRISSVWRSSAEFSRQAATPHFTHDFSRFRVPFQVALCQRLRRCADSVCDNWRGKGRSRCSHPCCPSITTGSIQIFTPIWLEFFQGSTWSNF